MQLDSQQSPDVMVLDDPVGLAAEAAPEWWPALAPETVAEHAPDLSLVVRGADGLRARCSLWWVAAPPLQGERVGAIGHYAASDGAAARALLERACLELAGRGCTLAIGPMDGSTWRSYRLVTDAGTEPPFFMEPANPPEWPGHWTATGFRPLAHYSSALDADLAVPNERATRAGRRLADAAVVVRALDPTDFDRELARIHQVAAVAFRENLLYTPLPEAAFAAQYRRVRPYIVPELVLVAEHDGRPVGFSFSLPDLLERQRGETPRTVIVKTVAILPGLRYGGLGTVLVERTRQAARTLGFERAVHALMHDANASRSISSRTGVRMRGYTLFARSVR